MDKQIGNLVVAISAGASDVPEVVTVLHTARAEREHLKEVIGSGEAAQVISLHPAIAEAYRNAVGNITSHRDGDDESARTGRAALRTLINAIILTPKKDAPGLDIDLEGRLDNIVSLATGGHPKEREGMLQVVAEERSGLQHTLRRMRL